MTREEFLAELAKTPRAWKLEDGRKLRCERGDCPITAVLRLHKPDHRLSPWQYAIAARYLGMDGEEFGIAYSADRENTMYNWRADLLKACGLA